MISSSMIAYSGALTTIRNHFAPKDMVTRQEVLDFENSGGYVPTKFWSVQRIGRGVFSLAETIAQTTIAEVVTKQFVDEDLPMEEIVDTSMVSHFNTESFIPSVDETFVEWGNYSTISRLVNSNKFFALFLVGDHGTGKDIAIQQACAKANRPYVRIQITRDTTEDQLIGSKTLIDGTIRYEEGPLVWAAMSGAIVSLSELDCGCPNQLMCLQNILEGKPFFVKALNKLITPTPGFGIIATANTKGRGSENGQYIGTNILNQAFMSRFMGTLTQPYPPAKIEKEIFQRHMNKFGLTDQAFMQRLVNWTNVIRKTYMDEGIDDHVDTRRACNILYLYSALGDQDLAIDMGVSQFDDTTQAAMKVLWEKMTPEETEDNAVSAE